MNDRSHYVQSRCIYNVLFTQNDNRQKQNKLTASAVRENRQCVSSVHKKDALTLETKMNL